MIFYVVTVFTYISTVHTQQLLEQVNSTDSLFKIRDYPSPPVNITGTTVYVDNEDKIMETTIFWDFEADERRTGFSLSMEAVGSECRSEFPGYKNNAIPPSSNSLRIPLELNDASLTMLEIMHDCTYRLKLQSEPHPPGDNSRYTTTFQYTVPHCIQGRCSCEDYTPLPPKNAEVVVVKQDRFITPRISWDYPQANNTAFRFEIELYFTRDDYFKDEIYDDLDESEDVNKTESLNRDGDDMIEKTGMSGQKVDSQKGQAKYSLIWPASLRKNEHYSVFIYAKNKHLCVSPPAIQKFDTTKESVIDIKDINEMIADEIYASQSSSSSAIINSSVTTQSSIAVMNGATASNSIRVVLIIWITISAALVFFFCICLFLFRKYCYQSRKSEIEKSSIIPWAMAHSRLVKSKEFVYEIPSNQIQVGAVIGQGAFGMVCMGTVMGLEGFGRPTTVAVKQLNANAEEFQKTEFTAEIEIMKQVGRHPNIVAMYGYCVEPNHQCMIMEYVPFGDLKHYLQELRKQFELAVYKRNSKWGVSDSPSTSLNSTFINTNDKAQLDNDCFYLDPNELQNFALQVANGMAHIESLGIIHRDLAARNILVGRSKQLKISDFGLSRRGVYVKTSKGIIPLRWLSVEAIEHNLYSTKSDVWAYGVVLWEICTLGGFPYASLSDKELLKHLQQGSRLEKPSSCANEIYDLMMKCWAEEPTQRPSFTSLCEYLNDLNNQECPYVEFLPDEELPPPEIRLSCVDTEAQPTMLADQKQPRTVVTATS